MIYHIMIDRFSGDWVRAPRNGNAFLGGTLRGITEHLDYIRSLGATAIMLTPFFKTAGYHGYHITDYEQVDPHFGTWDDVRELILQAHSRHMQVIADFVPNHCHVDHPFFQSALHDAGSPYRDWFYFSRRNPLSYTSFLWYKELPKFNLERRPVADYFIGIATRLIREGIDGLRVDHALGVPFSFLSRLRREVHACNPDAVVFGEAWPYGVTRRYFNTLFFRSNLRRAFFTLFGIGQEAVQRDYCGVLDGVLDFEFRNLLLREIRAGRRLEGNIHLLHRLEKHFTFYEHHGLNTYLFLDNHDTDRFLFDCHGDKTLLEEAIQLMKDSGKPYLIYYGTECGMQNDRTIFHAEPYADLRVRQPMDWTGCDKSIQ